MNFGNDITLDLFDEARHSHVIDALTELLHSAYAPLAAKGMRYLATHQPPSKTLQRLKEGESYLLFIREEIIGTVTLHREKIVSNCEYYKQNGIYSFGQFAVHPSEQGKGHGAKIMDFLEKRAKALGAIELALDTSEHAEQLITMYEKRGYKIVSYAQWDETNYRSVIMSKTL